MVVGEAWLTGKPGLILHPSLPNARFMRETTLVL